jgi:phosphopantothenoylcysteine decarboxylase/phosphopantothenate--cysteine ligase
MGFAIATQAAARGAHVTLVAGPTSIDPPPVGQIIRVRRATEMHAAVMEQADGADVVIMAAAVADYMPAEVVNEKIAKVGDTLTLILKRTPDILGDLGTRRLASGRGPLLVGFAAETHDLVPHAIEKLRRKHADLIVANDVSRGDAGFDVTTNAVTLIGADGAETVPVQSKDRIAAIILDRVERFLEHQSAPAARRP